MGTHRPHLPTLRAAVLLFMVGLGGCTATPLPTPPSFDPTQLALTDTGQGEVRMVGQPGAIGEGSLTLRVTGPEAVVETPVMPNGSFDVMLRGTRTQVFHLEAVDRGYLGTVTGGPGDTAVAADPGPDRDGDGSPDAVDCLPDDARRFECAGSCAELLREGLAAGDGFYRLRPPGTPVAAELFCDFSSQGGGFTLVMRGEGGNVAGFSTAGEVSSGGQPGPLGTTFKLSDSIINGLRSTGSGEILLRADGLISWTRFASPTCNYSHTTLSPECAFTTADPGGTDRVDNADPDSLGIADWDDPTCAAFECRHFISTNRVSSGHWQIGDGAMGSTFCLGTDPDCNFTMWVR